MKKEEETNQWTRERSYLEQHGPDLLMLLTAVFFLVLTIGGVAFILIQPNVPGLRNVFSDPPPPRPNPMDQKLHLAPGEHEVILFPTKPKTPPAPKPAGKK